MRVVVSGGAGFIGSSIALYLKNIHPSWEVLAFDNLRRRGSELNLTRFRQLGVRFVHGDIRNVEDLDVLPEFDAMVECSAEPSVSAGYNGGARYLVGTNLVGTANCLELAAKHCSNFIFLSTSRVYSLGALNGLRLVERATRFELAADEMSPGISAKGITEAFSIERSRSLYGATKLASELLLMEYVDTGALRGVINRCGVVAGPWQMGKVDQGFFVHWVAKHLFGGSLSYIGYGGSGKQVRDILHVADLCDLIDLQILKAADLNGQLFNVGGGMRNSLSLLELTECCRRMVGNDIRIEKVPAQRAGDIPYYVTDNEKVQGLTGWHPRIALDELLEDVWRWISEHRVQLETVIG